MGEACEIFLDKETYNPGDVINGRVQCTFYFEFKVSAIKLLLKGGAKVFWKEGRYTTYKDEKVYFEIESDLLLDEASLMPGVYSYPFTYNLPNVLPSSMEEIHGSVKYSIQVTIYRPCKSDHETEQIFTVGSYNDLNNIDSIKRPLEFSEEKVPFSLFSESGPIKIFVNLPRNGYVPSQVITFSAKVKNNSNINVQEIRFKLVQGFEFHAQQHNIHHDSFAAPECTVNDSFVAPGNENTWNLELSVPSDMFVGNMDNSKLITIFWELRGEVCLPFPHSNFSVRVPLILGSVPLAGTII